MRIPTSWLAIALTALAVTSCTEKPAAPVGPVWEEPQLSELLKVYHQKLPGKTRVLELLLTRENDRLRVYDPASPKGVVEYSYFHSSPSDQTRWSGPEPGYLERSESLKDGLFTLDQVALSRIPELVRTAQEKMTFEGATVFRVLVKRSPAPARELQIEIIFNGKNNSGRVLADGQGNVLKVEML